MTAEISGYALEWQAPANIAGVFIERFARGAFDKSLIENPDVVCLWAHDSSKPLGRVANGSLKLISDSIGLRYELTPNPDSPMGQEAIAAVGRGDVGQVSVSFFSEVEQWDDTGDLPQRLITQAGLVEISLLVWGAYGKATSATLYSRQSNANDNATNARRRLLDKIEAAHRLRGIR
ncbi:HK97 family phage prohead protease [Mesorhizobium sp. INR15]|uniref:HK97 family phage prohead protease n=1 Tax=Mesorhizobium sp. INR15 TaxID=2654248 RepID=UPI00189683F2|nr:HK97 family phage prohead protease [Mesorhizobium sp. INR15]QPC93536.1 HK97 family phage prohead protease [Mesorhizobium sp. INR15]